MTKGIPEDYLICHPFKSIAKFDSKYMLEFKNIHKSFGEREILSGVNLKLENGNDNVGFTII